MTIKRRKAADIAADHDDRELVGKDSAKGGTLWRTMIEASPEYRSMPDQPLPDVWYAEAKRVAATLGQEAATSMLQAEEHRRRLLALEHQAVSETRLLAAQGLTRRHFGTTRLLATLLVLALLCVASIYVHALFGASLGGMGMGMGAGSGAAAMSAR